MLLYDVLARTLLFLATTVIFGADHREAHHVTFLQLKTPVIELVLRSLTAETDVGNTEMLLGGHTDTVAPFDEYNRFSSIVSSIVTCRPIFLWYPLET